MEDAKFDAIVQWVNHNHDQRVAFFENLFLQVDVSSLAENFLNETVRAEVSPEVRESEKILFSRNINISSCCQLD